MRAVAEAAAKRVAMAPNDTFTNREQLKATERAKVIVDEQRRIADLVLEGAKSEGEKLGRALVEAGRATASALEWSIARYDAPLAIKRATLPIEVLTTMAAREKSFETRPSREILDLVRHVWASAAEDRWVEIDTTNESAMRVFNARVAMTPAEVAKAIGLRDGAARAGAVDKERSDAFTGLRALAEYKQARTPKSIIVARAEIMPLIVKIHTELVGTHAKFIPRSGSVADWPTERLRALLDPSRSIAHSSHAGFRRRRWACLVGHGCSRARRRAFPSARARTRGRRGFPGGRRRSGWTWAGSSFRLPVTGPNQSSAVCRR